MSALRDNSSSLIFRRSVDERNNATSSKRTEEAINKMKEEVMSFLPGYSNFAFEKKTELRPSPSLFQLNTSNKSLVSEQFSSQNFNDRSRKRPKAGPKCKKKNKMESLGFFEEEKNIDSDLLDIVGSINADKDIDSDSSADTLLIDDTIIINDSNNSISTDSNNEKNTFLKNSAGPHFSARQPSECSQDVKVQHVTRIKKEQTSDDEREVEVQHLTTIEKEVKNYKQGEMRTNNSILSKVLTAPEPNNLYQSSPTSLTTVEKEVKNYRQGEVRAGDSILSKVLRAPEPNNMYQSPPASSSEAKLSLLARNTENQLFVDTQQSFKKRESKTLKRKKMGMEEPKQKSADVTTMLASTPLGSNKNHQSFYVSMGLDEDLCDSGISVLNATTPASKNVEKSVLHSVEIENMLSAQVKTEKEESPTIDISSNNKGKGTINVKNQTVPTDDLHVSMTFEAESASEDDFDDEVPLSVLKSQKTSDQIDHLIKSEPEVNADVSKVSDGIINGIPLIKEELIEEQIETIVSYGKQPQTSKDILSENSSSKVKTEPFDEEYFLYESSASNNLASSKINAGQAYNLNSSSVECDKNNESNISKPVKKAIANDSMLKKMLNSKSKYVHDSYEHDSLTSGICSPSKNIDNSWETNILAQDVFNDSVSNTTSDSLAVRDPNELNLSLSIPPKNKNKKSLAGNKKKIRTKKANLIRESDSVEKSNSELQSTTELSSKTDENLHISHEKVTKSKKTKSRAKKKKKKKNTGLIYEQLQSPTEPGESTEVIKKSSNSNKKKTGGKKNTGFIYEDINVEINSELQPPIELSSKPEEKMEVVTKKSAKSKKKKTSAKKNIGLINEEINSELHYPIELSSKPEENTEIVNKINSDLHYPIELSSKPEENTEIVNKSVSRSDEKKSAKMTSDLFHEEIDAHKLVTDESQSTMEFASETDENTEESEETISVDADDFTLEENNKENETKKTKSPDENLPISLLIKRLTTSDDTEGTFTCTDISNRTFISESASKSTSSASMEKTEESANENSSSRKNALNDMALNDELFSASKKGKEKKKSRQKQNKKHSRLGSITGYEKTPETDNSTPLQGEEMLYSSKNKAQSTSDNISALTDLSFMGNDKSSSSFHDSQLDESQSTVGSLASTLEDFSSKSELSNSAFDLDSVVVSKKKKRRPRTFGWNKRKRKKKKDVPAAESSSVLPVSEQSLDIAHKSLFVRQPVVVIKNLRPSVNATRNDGDTEPEKLSSNETSSLPKGKRRKITTRKVSAIQSDNNSLVTFADSSLSTEQSESLQNANIVHGDIDIAARKISEIDSRSLLESDSVSDSVSCSSNNNNSTRENSSHCSDPSSKETASIENSMLADRSWKLTPSLNVQEIAKDIAQFEALLEKRNKGTSHSGSEQSITSLDPVNNRSLNQSQDPFHISGNDSNKSLSESLEADLNSRLNNNQPSFTMDSIVNRNQSLNDDIIQIKKEPNIVSLGESAENSVECIASSLNPFRKVLSENELVSNKVAEVNFSEVNLIPICEKVAQIQNSFPPSGTDRHASMPNQRINIGNFENEINLSSTEQNLFANSPNVDANCLGLSIKREVFDVTKGISSNNFAIRDQDDLIKKACGSFNSSSVSKEKSRENSCEEIQILSSDDEDITRPNSPTECRAVTEKTCEHNKEINSRNLSECNFEQTFPNKHPITSVAVSDPANHKTDAVDVHSKNVEISTRRNLYDARMLYLLAMKDKNTEYLKHPYPPAVVSCNKMRNSKNKAYERISSKTWNLTIEEVKGRLKHSVNTGSELENDTADVIKLETYDISSCEVECYHRILGVAPSHKLLSKCSPNKLNEIIDKVLSYSNQQRNKNEFETNINEMTLLDSSLESNSGSSHTFSSPIAVSDLPPVTEKSNVQFDASIARLCRRSEKTLDKRSSNSEKFPFKNTELHRSSDNEISSCHIPSWSSSKPPFFNSTVNAAFNTDVFNAELPDLKSNSSIEHSYDKHSDHQLSTCFTNSPRENSMYDKHLDHQLTTCLSSNSPRENSSYDKLSDHQQTTCLSTKSSSENSLYDKHSDHQLSTCLSTNSPGKNYLVSSDILANLTLPSLETVNELLNSNKTSQTPFVETVSNSSIEEANSAVYRDSPSLFNKHLPVESVASEVTTTAIQKILNTINNNPVVAVNTSQSTSTNEHIPVESEALKTTDASQAKLNTNNLSSGLIDFPVLELRKILETVNTSSVSNNINDDSSGMWKNKETFEYNHTQSIPLSRNIPVAPENSEKSEEGNDSQSIPSESCETAAKQSENENSDDDFIDTEPVHHESDMEISDDGFHENEEPAPIPQYKSKWEKIMERKSQELKEREKINDFFLKDCVPVSSLKKPLFKKNKNDQDAPQPVSKKARMSVENDVEVQNSSSEKSIENTEEQSNKSKKNIKKKSKSSKSKKKSPSKTETQNESVTKVVSEKSANQKNKSVERKKGSSDLKRNSSTEIEDTSNLFSPDKLVKSTSPKKSAVNNKAQESKKSKLGTDNKTQENNKSKFYGNRVTNRGSFLTETSASEISKKNIVSKKKIPEAAKKTSTGQSEEFHSIIKSPNIDINPSLSNYKNQNKSVELQKKNEFLYKSPLSDSLPSKASHFIRTKQMRDRQFNSNAKSNFTFNHKPKKSRWDSSNVYDDDMHSKSNTFSGPSSNNEDEINRRNFMDTSSGYTSNRKTLLENPTSSRNVPLLEIPPAKPPYQYNIDNMLGHNIPSSSSMPSISTNHPTDSFQSNVDPSTLVTKIMSVFHTNTVPVSEMNVSAFPVPASSNTTNICSSSFGINDASMMQYPYMNPQSSFPVNTVMSSGYNFPNIPAAGSLDPRRAALGIQHNSPVDSAASLNPFRNIPPTETLDPRKAALANSPNIPISTVPSLNPFRNIPPVESLDPRKIALGIHSVSSFRNSPQEANSPLLNSPQLPAHVQVPRKASCLVPQDLKSLVGKQTIETQSVLLLMLEWSVDWLMQQQKSHDPPPICQVLRKVVSSYDNFEEYYNTYFPLMLLETWQRIYVSWTDLNQTAPYLCQIISYSVKSNYVSVECQSVFSTESRPKGVFPDEGSILMVKYSTKSNEYTIKILGYVTHVKTRHFNPVTDSKICSSIPIKSDTKPETLQILTLTFMGAYNSEDIDKRQPVCIHVLCNVKHTLKQNDALLYINKSPLHRSILNPVADGLLTFSLTPRSSPEEKVHECVRDITKGILSPHPLPLLTIVRASPESDRFKIIPLLIQKMKIAYKTKVLLCVRTVRALGDIAANICLQQQALKLVIINKRCDTNPQFQKYLLDEIVASEMKKDEEKGKKEKLNAKNEAFIKMRKQILKECDVVLSLVRNSHDDFIGSTFLETESIPQMCCIIDEANLCTEPETLIPILHGISKLILIGDPDYSAKVLSKAASSYDYNQSFFQRAYDLDLLTD